MSVESFCNKYLVEEGPQAIVIEGQGGKSLPVIFAEELAREG